MASPEPNEKPAEHWKPHQRPGTLGVDYDDYGAEMAPSARIWKKYVEETDKMDKELVEEWNSMLDITLLFAALFSAISTAFVLESSKDLKPDYTERTAQTLLLVSQSLTTISRGLPVDDSNASQVTPEFTPPHSAIIVNILWFLSLSISVVVSLVAILAKDWCKYFMAGRVGSPLKQGRIRQQRWDAIKQWKMREIMNVLPLLMHIALLLFAVGLSFYLWDINVLVALPIVATTSLGGLFYMITTSLPLFFPFCPYTTSFVRFLYPYWFTLLANHYTTRCIGILVASLAWISHSLKRLKRLIIARRRDSAASDSNVEDLQETVSLSEIAPFAFAQRAGAVADSVYEWLGLIAGSRLDLFSSDRLQLVEKETPMDDVTSLMLAWIIWNCEDPKSVDMALQALAGAKPLLPRRDLWESGVIQLLCERIGNCINPYGIYGDPEVQPDSYLFLDEASLYSRSLRFATALIRGEGIDMRQKDSANFVIEPGSAPLKLDLDYLARLARYCTLYETPVILSVSWIQPSPRYEIAAYELGAVPLEAGRDVWDTLNSERQLQSKQRDLLELVITGQAVGFPSGALASLLGGMARSFFYEPAQSPIPFIKLLCTLSYHNSGYRSVSHAAAIGLVVAVFASGSYPGRHNKENKSPNHDATLKRAKCVLDKLVLKELAIPEDDCLIIFGLLSLLGQKNQNDWVLSMADVNIIGQCLYQWQIDYDPPLYHTIIPTVPSTFGPGQHLLQVISECLADFPQELNNSPSSSVADSPALSRLDAVLVRCLCINFGNFIIAPLVDHFMRTESSELKRLCLQGIIHCMWQREPGSAQVFTHLIQTDLLKSLLNPQATTNPVLALYDMVGLWLVCERLMYMVPELDSPNRLEALLLLRSLNNKFSLNLTDDTLPTSVDDLGLADMWLLKLVDLSRDNPQVVLDSSILRHMVLFYKDDKHINLIPRTEELPPPFNNSWAWINILEELENRCRKIVEQDAEGKEAGLDPLSSAVQKEDQRGDHSTRLQLDAYWAT